jgi:hypothetical protein
MHNDPNFVMDEAHRHMSRLTKEADDYRLARSPEGNPPPFLAQSLSLLGQALAPLWALLICSWSGGARRFPARCS